MKRTLQLKVWFVLVILLNIFSVQQSKASHAMGADLTYQCLGGNTYKITVSFYRDCIGIAAPTNPFVNINSTSCGQSLGVTCYARPGTGQEITPTCSSSVTTCGGGSFTGIQEWVYDGIVTLPMQCTDWVFSYNLCCRNAAITTITTPGSSTFYVYATLNNTISPHNSSPTFSNKPVPFICMGQQYCFNHGAYDPDGDSLSYSLITPKQTSGTNVHYIAPYSATNPLNSIPSTSFNSFTGDICLTPQAMQVTVMAVLVKEYRNGVLIGSVERDMQLTVMNCTNNLPTLSGINGTNNFSMTVCAGQPFCFNILSNDVDSGQNLHVTWDYGIPGGTFTQGTGPHPTSTFCWTPTASDISGTPHIFTVRVADDACPYIGSQIYSYSITVIGITANAGPDQQVACNDIATLTATASGGSGTYTYLWSNGSTMQSITVGGGTYMVTVSDGICSATDTVEVTMPFSPTAAFTTSNSNCTGRAIHFNDQSTTPGGILNYWNWDFGDSTNSGIQNPIHTYSLPGSYNVTLIVGNIFGCFDTLVQQVNVYAPPSIAFTAADACAGQQVDFFDQSSFSEHLNFWNWSFGDTTTSTSHYPNHIYSNPGTYQVSLVAGDTSGCRDTALRVVHVFPLPTVSAGADQTICAGGSATLTASGGTTYDWSPTNDTSATIVVSPGTTTNYFVTIVDSNSCIANDMVTVIVNPLPTANAGPDKTICLGSSTTLSATGGATYSWNPGGATTSTVIVSPAVNTTYTVTVTDLNGCSATDNLNVTVNPLPTAIVSADANICSGSNATLTASGGATYTWIPGGETTGIIHVSPSSNSTYTVIVSDGLGCSDTANVNVFVHTAPVVNLTSFFLCSGSVATLDAGNAGSTYAWSSGETTQVININGGGTYSVTVTNPYGCSTNSSVNIATGASITISLGNISFCQGDSAVLDAGHPGMTYSWTPNGATSQTITVSTPGTYGVTVTDTGGCSGSISANVQVNPIPVANFTSSNVCIGNTTSFSDVSSVSTGSINSWSWNFGDGSISTQQHPTHSYTSPGNYNVTLTVTSASGCSQSISHPVIVNPLPTANFNFVNDCLNSALTFADNSSVSSGNITGYSWDFGDGGTSALQNPSHQYAAEGNYNVILTVTTAGGCINTVTKTVTVYPLPVADFTSTTVCLGNQTAFSNNSTISTGSITTYAWDFGDSHTSSGHHPHHTYSSPGTYSVSLTVTSNHGCTNTTSYAVIVNALPVANAGTDQSICSGSNATLNASGGTSYAWVPGGDSTQTIVVNPSSSLMYTVTVTDINGCKSTDQVNVNVNPLPSAQAGPDRSICPGSTSTLNASGGLTYLWNPGGSTNSTISVTPVTTTDYIVTVTDANGCQAMDTSRITVNPTPPVNAGPDQAICIGSTISITATGALNYSWNPGGAITPNIIVTPLASCDYTVIGTDTNGCSKTDTMHVTVNNSPAVNIPTSFVCTGYSTTLDAGNPGCIFTWSTGESSQTISVTDSGNYSVLVTNSNGCSTLGNVNVTLAGSFVTNPISTSICMGGSATLNAGNPGCTYHWSTGETTQIIVVSTAGNYPVTVTDANGCAVTVVSNVSLNAIPNAAFSSAAACFGNSSVFIDQSSIASPGIIQNYNWNFGDGFSSLQSNPNHTYASTGTYNVTLTIVSARGCIDSVTQTVNVNTLPVADFSGTTVCKNQSTDFSDLSIVANGSIGSWTWNFGDSTTSSLQNPSHVYSSSGSFNATLIVATTNGCSDTITRNINVKGLPVAGFTGPNSCAEAIIQFSNTSYSNNGTISGYNWDFGNGQQSGAINPGIAYANSGNYSVHLVVTSSLGCADTVQQNITAYPLPVAAFASPAVCQNSVAVFTDHSSVTNGTITSLYWNFGDGSSSNQFNPSHGYANNGTYNVMQIATTNHQCIDTSIQIVTIHPLPTVNFIAQDVCVNTSVNFSDNSTITSGSITSWLWDFGDGSTSSQNSPAHIYVNPGTYSVSLTATSNFGCSKTFTSNINIFPNPVAAFAGANVCYSFGTQFFNQSYISGGSSFTSSWNFNDGITSTLTSPVHTFTTPGNYNITLTVTSTNGCSSQTSHSLSVYTGPTASFSAGNGCLGTQSTFIDNSTAADGTVSGWLWQFSDGTSSTSNAPVHVFVTSGIFNVTLTTYTNFGCYNTTSGIVEIYPVPSPAIQTNNACVGTAIDFSDVSASNLPGNIVYAWDFGDGNYSSDSATSNLYQDPGTYDVMLVTSNNYNCYSTDMVSVDVYPNPEATFSTSGNCFPVSTEFNNASRIETGNITSYNWNFGDGNNSSAMNPSHTYAAPGTYTATLVSWSDFGCVSADTQLVRINPYPNARFNSSLQGCGPLRASFTDSSWISSGSIAGWLWDFGDGGVSTDQHPSYIYTQSGRYSVSLTIVSDEGCQSSFSLPNSIYVFPAPDAKFTADPTITDVMNPLVQFTNLSQGYTSYQWNFSDGTRINNILSPSHVFADTGTYTAELITLNNYGCRDTAMSTIEVRPHSTLYAPNCFTPNNDGKNDVFKPSYTQMDNIQVWIFDRWGELLKNWTGLDGYWDGYYKGNACQEDVYVYQIRGLGLDGKNYEWTGHVSIVH